MYLCTQFAIKYNNEWESLYETGEVYSSQWDGDGCPHCAALHKYIENLKEEAEYKNKFNIIYYEVWNSPSNSDLVTKVKEYTGLKATGVPVYIIGDKIMYGYSKTREKEIEATIKHELENSNYKDVVEIVKNK